MAAMKKDFVERNPIATKRAIRALLKAADLCSEKPEMTARVLVRKGFAPSYEMGLEIIEELPYGRWRTDNPEDTLRFHGLRLYEVGMLKTHPNNLIEEGADFSFLNELKKEMKA
jgi:NitT/TauT family transport system substrate-binding protein